MTDFTNDWDDQEARLRVAALLVAINVGVYTAAFNGWLWTGWIAMAASLSAWVAFVAIRSQQSVDPVGRPNRL